MDYAMGTKEMSDLFDVLYNNITSNQAPGLNEYEKSVFLTKAQDEIVKNYFLPQSNPKQAGFDGNQKRQIDFSMLMATAEGTNITATSHISYQKFDPRSNLYGLPTDVNFIVNEQLILTGTGGNVILGIRQVRPISMDEYSRLMSKPYKEPVKYEAWRLITGNWLNAGEQKAHCVAEIVMTSADKAKVEADETGSIVYSIRYVKKPRPIILTNFASALGEDLKIHGEKTEMECKLDPILHEEIVQRAVELAKVAWVAQGNENLQAVMQAGQRSE